MKYLVRLRLHIGQYEKHTYDVVDAENEKEAGIEALTNECHCEPDFDEFPDKDACWDCGEMVYRVMHTLPITDSDARLFNTLTRGY